MSNLLSNILIIVLIVSGVTSIVWLIQSDHTEAKAACVAAGGVSTHHGCLVKLEIR